jgi:hypothetical protein
MPFREIIGIFYGNHKDISTLCGKMQTYILLQHVVHITFGFKKLILSALSTVYIPVFVKVFRKRKKRKINRNITLCHWMNNYRLFEISKCVYIQGHASQENSLLALLGHENETSVNFYLRTACDIPQVLHL